MKCPNCDYAKLQVQETRDAGEEVIRVRKCPICKWLVTTSEVYREDQTIPTRLRKRKPQ